MTQDERWETYKKYAEKKEIPLFSHGPTCYRCNTDLTSVFTGEELEKGKFKLITGCYNCHVSYVD
jgi:hypothetical protein